MPVTFTVTVFAVCPSLNVAEVVKFVPGPRPEARFIDAKLPVTVTVTKEFPDAPK